LSYCEVYFTAVDKYSCFWHYL